MIDRIGENRLRRITNTFLVCFTVLILLFAAMFFIRIRSIEVEGDVTMFNESEIIAAAEINEGDSLFFKTSGRIRRNIERNMPVVQKVRVIKSPLGKVVIRIELAGVDYYCEYDGLYYAIDEDLNVLDCNKDRMKYSAYGAVKVILPELRKPTVGEKLVYYDTVVETNTEKETIYEVREESYYDYTRAFLCQLKESGYHSEANGVIVDEKFDITLIYAEKFLVNFGDSLDLDVKFRIFYEIMVEGSMQYAEKVRVDLSDPSRATARADLTLDFSEFFVD